MVTELYYLRFCLILAQFYLLMIYSDPSRQPCFYQFNPTFGFCITSLNDSPLLNVFSLLRLFGVHADFLYFIVSAEHARKHCTVYSEITDTLSF